LKKKSKSNAKKVVNAKISTEISVKSVKKRNIIELKPVKKLLGKRGKGDLSNSTKDSDD